jgi:hypothetical protein
MENANKDREEERNLPRDLPWGRLNTYIFLNSMRFLFIVKDFQRKDLLIG